MPNPKKITSVKNIDLQYTVYGEGKSLLLIHGFGEDSSVWDLQIETLSKQYRLIVPDLPGSGGADRLKKENAGLNDYAEMMNEILMAEGIDQIAVIGHSMGGYIALAYAEMYPARLTALGLFHSSAFADDEEKKTARKKSIDFILKNGTKAFLDSTIPGMFYDAGKSRNEIATLSDKGNYFTADTLIQYYRAMIGRNDKTHILKGAEMPVLMILGVHDKAVPFELGLKQSYLAKVSQVSILRNSGHMGMLEEPEEANKILGEFLHFVHLNQ